MLQPNALIFDGLTTLRIMYGCRDRFVHTLALIWCISAAIELFISASGALNFQEVNCAHGNVFCTCKLLVYDSYVLPEVSLKYGKMHGGYSNSFLW